MCHEETDDEFMKDNGCISRDKKESYCEYSFVDVSEKSYFDVVFVVAEMKTV